MLVILSPLFEMNFIGGRVGPSFKPRIHFMKVASEDHSQTVKLLKNRL